MPLSNQPHFHRALFVRLDRIGDLVLTLPTDQSLSIDEVDWWIPQGLSFVTDAALPQRRSSEYSKRQTLPDAFKLASFIRKNCYDFVVVFQAPWWVGLVVWLARIPVRIGVKSQWHSFLFFNRGVRQKRSRAEMSELEYGYRLLEEGLGLPSQSLRRTTLKLRSKSGPSALEKLASKTGQKTRLIALDYYVVHPGMGGSALNWPVDKYADLISELARERHVVITGTASDKKFLMPLKERLQNDVAADPHENIVWLDEQLSGDELISVLESSLGVIAPSTGVVHLAASTGRPTVGIYSQVPVERAIRWGPQGERVAVVEAPMTEDYQHGMSLIQVREVIQKLRELGP